MNSKREFLGKTGMYFPNLFNPFNLNLVVALMKQLSAFCHNLKKNYQKLFSLLLIISILGEMVNLQKVN
jgi:hypothetical protein